MGRIVLLTLNRPRGVVVNMSPCHGEDHRFDPGRGRRMSDLD
jgi:hypothetical protein